MECKGCCLIVLNFSSKSFNRDIVECKDEECKEFREDGTGFNRDIVECKVILFC